MSEKQSLPVGVIEFHFWSNRIISEAGLSATAESQKFALANILLQLPSTTSFECDEYFIQCLRKSAVNQVAEFIREETRNAAKARLAALEQQKLDQQKSAEATAPLGASAKVLENNSVCGAQ